MNKIVPDTQMRREEIVEEQVHAELKALRNHNDLGDWRCAQTGEAAVWWEKEDVANMPVLNVVARCGAVTPLSSVEVERVFSIFGR